MSLFDSLTESFSGLLETQDDEETPDQTAQLAALNSRMQALLEQSGGAEATGATLTTSEEFIAAPSDGEVLGVQAGTTTLDFDNGVIKNSTLDETLTDNLKSVSDLSASDTLRGLALWVDVPALISIDDREELVVGPGVHTFDSANFDEVEVTTNSQAQLAAMASTRSDAPTRSLGREFARVAKLAASTYDSYQALGWTTPDVRDRNDSYGTGVDKKLPVAGQKLTILVTNTSSAANDINVQVRGRADEGEEMRELAASSSPVTQGDHVLLEVADPVDDLDVRIRNDVNGETVAAEGQVFGVPQ